MPQQQKSRFPVEQIPGDDLISRCCFVINGVRPLDPSTEFRFSTPNDATHPPDLSVIWRKYAVERYHVDQRGEAIAKVKNERKPGGKRSGRSVFTYIGYRTAKVQAIRDIRTEREFGFLVSHSPSNDFRGHAHIAIQHADKAKPLPNDKRDLMSMLNDRMPVDEEPPT